MLYSLSMGSTYPYSGFTLPGVGGGGGGAITINTTFTTTTPYAVTATDNFVGVDATGGNKIVNLPVAVTGRQLTIKNTGAIAVVNTVAVTPNGVATIDSVAGAFLLTGTQSITLVARTGTGWYVL